MNNIVHLFDNDLLASVLRISTPILFAALGGLLCMRSGILNIGLEGMMLVGAFFGITFVAWTGNSWVGLMMGSIAGGVTSLILALVVLRFKADHIITGIAINIFGLGITSFLLKVIFKVEGAYRPTTISSLPIMNIPFLKNVPLLGPMFYGQSIMVYIGFIFVIVTYLILYWTPFGLSVRAVGEHSLAALSAGINPTRIKFLCILWSGFLSGLAGAYLSVLVTSEFTENMIAGRGFTAFTAVIFGGQNPIFTYLATLVFGFADALGVRVQLEGFGLPPSVLQMFPYIVTIFVLVFSSAMRLRKRHTPLGGIGL